MRKLSLILFLLFFCCSSALANIGARPLGMGGAFIGLANDINTIAWNPAGLPNLYQLETTYTRTLNKRHNVNYNDFFALGAPWQSELLRGGWGLSYTDAQLKDPITLDLFTDRWINLGLGLDLTPDFSAGCNIRYFYGNQKDQFGNKYQWSSAWEFDLAFHLRLLHPLHFGLLVENINNPRVRFHGPPADDQTIPMNIRPGLALHLSPRSVITLDIYDLKGNVTGKPSLNLGWEQRWGNFFLTRIGANNKTFTFGLAADGPNNRYDYTYMAGEFDTHFFGMSRRF